MKKAKKRIIIAAVVAVLIGGSVAGVMVARRNSRRAFVMSVADMNLGAYYYDEQSFSGTVYEGAQQKIFANSDKTVDEVYVKTGEKVKKGDKLFRYDTTLLELDVQEKQLSVTICENALSVERARLEQYCSIVPVEPTAAPPEEEISETDLTDASGELPSDNPDEPNFMIDDLAQTDDLDETEEEDFTPHYTAQEKADLITDQELTVKKAQNSLSFAEQALIEAQDALESATVTSSLDGTVTQIQDPKALDNTTSFCTVIGDSGVTIKGMVDELDLSSIQAGDKLTVTSWMTDAFTEAEVISVSDYPLDSGWGNGNPNVSYYEFTAFMEDAEEFEIGEEVSITKTSGEDTTRIMIEKIYVRTDADGSYVMKDVDGVLTRQPVKTRECSDSEYIIITEGLSDEDMIAFPYGSLSKEGLLTTTEYSGSLF